ncbi:MAG: hypothetical protein ABIA76_06195 [Candidatus Diapherotrites archaeon]
MQSNLLYFFGKNPFLRILDVFIDNLGEDYAKKEVQELAGISKGALFNHWSKLEGLALIKITRQFGNTKLFTLNTGSIFVQDILKFKARMIEETMPKEKNERKLLTANA